MLDTLDLWRSKKNQSPSQLAFRPSGPLVSSSSQVFYRLVGITVKSEAHPVFLIVGVLQNL